MAFEPIRDRRVRYVYFFGVVCFIWLLLQVFLVGQLIVGLRFRYLLAVLSRPACGYRPFPPKRFWFNIIRGINKLCTLIFDGSLRITRPLQRIHVRIDIFNSNVIGFVRFHATRVFVYFLGRGAGDSILNFINFINIHAFCMLIDFLRGVKSSNLFSKTVFS